MAMRWRDALERLVDAGKDAIPPEFQSVVKALGDAADDASWRPRNFERGLIAGLDSRMSDKTPDEGLHLAIRVLYEDAVAALAASRAEEQESVLAGSATGPLVWTAVVKVHEIIVASLRDLAQEHGISLTARHSRRRAEVRPAPTGGDRSRVH